MNKISKTQTGLRLITVLILFLQTAFFVLGIYTSGWLKLILFSFALILAILLIPAALLDIREVKKHLNKQQDELIQELSKVPLISSEASKNGHPH